jgi:cobalamin-dependent methionine synthase I
VVFSLITIGVKLEHYVSKLSAEGKLQQSVILDAIGSTAAECVADFVNKRINEKAIESGYDYTNRFSPGYCIWDIDDQKLFFDLLPAKSIGVILSQTQMMNPRKSITFAVNLGSKNKMDMDIGKRNCKTCTKTDCKYRYKKIV